MQKVKSFFNQHLLIIILAIVVGIISVAPQLFFIFNPGVDYQGIPILAAANEDAYLSRMNEVLDGHTAVGNAWFYEYKDAPFLLPPVSEIFNIAIGKLFFLSLINTILLFKFLWPAVLAMLIYFLVYRLIDEDSFESKITASAAALFVTLGYDLIDYRTVFNTLRGQGGGSAFLLWTRPINPITGALVIFSFLITLWSLVKKYSSQKLVLAGIFCALGFYTYFFTWAYIFSILAFFGLFLLIQKRFDLVKIIFLILVVAIILGIPYYLISFNASQSPEYIDSAARAGLIHTHNAYPNKLLIFSLVVYLLLSWNIIKNKTIIRNSSYAWWWLCLSFLVGGLWALNQQVVTGIAIWPPHFVQYTIPLSAVALLVLLHKVFKPVKKYFWGLVVSIVIVSSIIYGVTIQISSYKSNFDTYKNLQGTAQVFSWFNQNSSKDSVILTIEDEAYLKNFIPIFTHNNVYTTENIITLMPIERIVHNYMINLKIKNIHPDQLNNFIEENIVGYKFIFGGIAGFDENIDSVVYLKNKDMVPSQYPEFYVSDFYEELKKYRLDYVLSDGEPSTDILSQLPQLELVTTVENFYIYQLP